MDGPVLSGGVIVLVAVLLWLLYLLPSWRGRYQYNAAERNAVRLNQALRVLAETSETPDEIRLELNARTAHAQQRLAKRVQSEREAAELARLREELAATQADPVLRQARARLRVRLAATGMLVLGLVTAGLGVWQLIAVGGPLWIWVGGVLAVAGVAVLQRMRSVAARAAGRGAAPVVAAEPAPVHRESPAIHDQGPATWTPRRLPEPLVSTPGSRAQAAQAQIEAQQERERAARRAELAARAERIAPEAPVELPVAAPVPAAEERAAEEPAAESPYAKMGFVDDAEIEAHVRRMLARRAAG